MSLIIKNKITELFKGYPTVSDKYNVQGGILEGTDEVVFGELLAYGATTGHYVKATTVESAADIAGIALATNVKLFPKYPAGSNTDTPVVVGETVNLLVNGFVAIEVAVAEDTTQYATEALAKTAIAATEATLKAAIKEGAAVKITTAGKFDTAGTITLDAEYTGIYEYAHRIEAVKVSGVYKYVIKDQKVLAEIAYEM